MAAYVDKDLGQGTVTSKDYDLYCHYGEYSDCASRTATQHNTSASIEE